MSKLFLMRHPGHCTGMFWRGNPKTGKKATGLPDWPKNGALLRGHVHTLDKPVEGSIEWLEVIEYQQAGARSFTPVPKNTWMQFDQGGRLLHLQEE